jgi:hypothetical protein
LYDLCQSLFKSDRFLQGAIGEPVVVGVVNASPLNHQKETVLKEKEII